MNMQHTEIRVTVHFPEEVGKANRLYTLTAKTNAEYVALLVRLASYAFREERLIDPESLPIDPKEIQHEKESLEWRLKALNGIVHTALSEG